MTDNNERVLIIGGGIAGRNVVRDLIRLGKRSGIFLVKKETHSSYSPCGLPYVIGGEVGAMEDILFPNFDRRLKNNNVQIMKGTEVKKFDLANKKAETDKGGYLAYDRLVIATGRKPHLPQLPGIEKAGVCTLSDYEDGLRIYDELSRLNRVVIIGGGFIGCELAAAFLKRGIETTLIEIKPHILPQILDESMASLVQNRLMELGCRIITGKGVSRINGTDEVESVSIDGVESPVAADLVVIAIGVGPETALAEQTGFEIGEFGGLITDSRQHPKAGGEFLEDVYALGDCVEVKNALTGTNTLSPLTETAIVQARIVALDISGNTARSRNEIEKGYVCSSLTVVGDLEVGMTGLTTAEAEKAGIHPRAVQTTGWSKEVYFPGRTKTHSKLLTHGDRLIGAQIIGKEDVKGIINELNALIREQIKIEDILCRQRSYTPALCSSPDVVMKAIEKLIK